MKYNVIFNKRVMASTLAVGLIFTTASTRAMADETEMELIATSFNENTQPVTDPVMVSEEDFFMPMVEEVKYNDLNSQMDHAVEYASYDLNKDIHEDYKVTNVSPITAEDLNSYLGGALSGMGQTFVDAGLYYGIDPAFLAAVAVHETGNGTSDAAYSKNNIGGFMGTSDDGGSELLYFTSVEDSIWYMAELLAGDFYIASGLDTPAEIQEVYCPVGAANDPTGLNVNWLSGVTSYWQDLRNLI